MAPFNNLIEQEAGDFARKITRLDVREKPRSLEKYALDRDCILLSRELRRGTVNDEGKRLLTRLPTEHERGLLRDRLNYLHVALMPARAAECANEIARLLAGYLSAKSQDPQMAIREPQLSKHSIENALW
jgi:hypothetical protein